MATDADDDDDGSISASDMAHESCDDEDNACQLNQTREECPEWIDDTDEHSCSPQTVPPVNARKRKSHAVIKRRAITSESSDEDEQSYVISKIVTKMRMDYDDEYAMMMGTYVQTRLLTTRDMNIS